MIYTDENTQILLAGEAATVLRGSTAVSYSLADFARTHPVFEPALYRSVDGHIFSYAEGMLIKHGCPEEQECLVGSVVDFCSINGNFYFVKSKINRMILVNHENKVIAEFPRIFCISQEFLYFAEFSGEPGVESPESLAYYIIRLDLLTMTRRRVAIVDTAISQIAARNDNGVDVIAISDDHNNLHVINGERRITYHWSSNRILDVVLLENYVVTASKDGRVAKFGISRDERLFLFEYLGEFVDMKASCGRLYFLSSIYFMAYDLGLEQVLYKDILPASAPYSVVSVASAEPAGEDDIFKIKRQSKTEVRNSLGDEVGVYKGAGYIKSSRQAFSPRPERGGQASDEMVGFVNGNVFFLVDRRGFRAQFVLGSLLNFISDNMLISVGQSKSKTILHVYAVYMLKLVYLFKREVARMAVDSVHSGTSGLYIRNAEGLHLVNDMGMVELVHDADMRMLSNTPNLMLLDSRGLFDADAVKYVFKQKHVSQFCICDGKPLFYLKEHGLYLYGMERTLLGCFEGLISLASTTGAGPSNCFYVLSTSDGQKFLALYRLQGKKIVLVSQDTVEAGCGSVLTGWAFMTQKKQLLIID